MSDSRPMFAGPLNALLAVVLGLLVAGCATTSPEREARMHRGYVFYCDGSGGGGTLRNYAGGVRNGLVEAGYPGAGEMFPWHTGLGVTADHTASVGYKRKKGEELARRIQEYSRQHPDAPVTAMGLSAGTAIVVFGLEALPASRQVDNALLLAPSVSADYNLTESLQRVGHRMYVFVSENDGVLRHLLPMFGTADRQRGRVGAAGLRGFQRPENPSAQTQAQYAKLVHVHWEPEFRGKGHGGGHTDVVNARFVREYIAPLVMDMPTRPTKLVTKPKGKVRNPDYERWADAAPGSWVRSKGYEIIGGRRVPLYVKVTLVEKQADMLIVEWAYFADGSGDTTPERVQNFIEKAWIDPEGHPRTHPRATVTDLPKETVKIGDRVLTCDVRSIDTAAEFPDWGRNVSAKVCTHDDLPGKVARASVKSHKGEQPFEFFAEVVDYEMVR